MNRSNHCGVLDRESMKVELSNYQIAMKDQHQQRKFIVEVVSFSGISGFWGHMLRSRTWSCLVGGAGRHDLHWYLCL